MRLIPADPDIATVVARIHDGTLDLQPDFQRGAVWPRPKQRLLVDSVLRSWYVPPIHVVRTTLDEQIVLDGQQRLRAIFEFVEGHFGVDGHAEPFSRDIAALDGLRYTQLPDQVRRRFDRFTLRVFEVIDYAPQEPYELFFRLNQPTTLTSAEKRNAFFGQPREQIRALTEAAVRAGMRPERVGFQNSRLAYEDIVARFVWTLERGSLAEGVSAARLTERYRHGEPFHDDVVLWAQDSLTRLFGLHSLNDRRVRLNKATTHSWLCFIARGLRTRDWHLHDGFVAQVERLRARHRGASGNYLDEGSEGKDVLLALLNDRATARVNDVASVLIRDVVLWILYTEEHGVLDTRLERLASASRAQRTYSEMQSALLDAAAQVDWERLR